MDDSLSISSAKREKNIKHIMMLSERKREKKRKREREKEREVRTTNNYQ